MSIKSYCTVIHDTIISVVVGVFIIDDFIEGVIVTYAKNRDLYYNDIEWDASLLFQSNRHSH